MARTPFRYIAVLCASLVAGLTHAQDSEPYAADPPDRAARLSFISGDVSLQPAGESDWTAALVNRPLTTGDKLWTEQNARAEIYVGPAAVRLDGSTGFSFLNVDDDTIQMRVTAGILNVSVRTLDGGENIEIDTPNVALTLLRAGNYRVEVNDAGDATVVKVSEGSVQATGGGQDNIVYSQQVATFSGAEDVIAQYGTLGSPDDFDSWSLERDRRDELAANSRTTEYVSPEVTGYQDLDHYGNWYSEPGYGYVWAPTYVNVGWAPYRYGRWVSIAPWGWTWIDDSPWGYAPFHYGRWAHVRNRWCWVPGPRHARPVYAPALVGWGPSHGGHVSWFPLGPRETYVPGYRFSRHYVERVNMSNTVVARELVNRVYDNQRTQGGTHPAFSNRVAGAVTATSTQAFTSAGRVGQQRIQLNDRDLATGSANSVAPRLVASRQGRMGGPTRTNVRVPPTSVANRQVVVHREPPSAAAHFARRQVENRDREVAARTPERNDHPRDRASFNGNNNGAPENTGRVERPDRGDRPPRVDRPASDSAPPMRSSVFDREALSGRVRADRDRQVREVQQQRDTEVRNSWQPSEQTRPDSGRTEQDRQDRPQREQSQRSRELQQQLRESVQRQQEQSRREQPRHEAPRQEQPRQEQPRYEQPRQEQPRREQPRYEAPRQEQPRYQQPRQEQPRQEQPRPQQQPRAERPQPQRSEDRGSSESRSHNRNDNARPNRN